MPAGRRAVRSWRLFSAPPDGAVVRAGGSPRSLLQFGGLGSSWRETRQSAPETSSSSLDCHKPGCFVQRNRTETPRIVLVAVCHGWRPAASCSSIGLMNPQISITIYRTFAGLGSDLVSCSNKVANSKSKSASSRRSGKSNDPYGDGSAQSVHSRAILKLPHCGSRRISVSIPATRRFLSTSKRWPRRGWNGWRISAQPKCDLRSGAVRADRPFYKRPRGANRSQDRAGADLRGRYGTKCLWLPTEAKCARRYSESA